MEDAQECTSTLRDEELFQSCHCVCFPGSLTVTGPNQMLQKPRLLWKSLPLSIQGKILSIIKK